MAFLGPLLGGLMGGVGGLLGSGGPKLSPEQKQQLQLMNQMMMADYGTKNQIIFGPGGLNAQLATLGQDASALGQDATNPSLQFYDQFLQQGNPYLQNLQAQTSADVAQNYNNAAGNAAQAMASKGYGFAPSGAGAAVAGDLARGSAETASTQWLNNLLNNENQKFQAASGAESARMGAQNAMSDAARQYAGMAGMYNPAQYAGTASGIANNPRGGSNPLLGFLSGAAGGALNGMNNMSVSASPTQVPMATSGTYNPGYGIGGGPGSPPIVPIPGASSAYGNPNAWLASPPPVASSGS